LKDDYALAVIVFQFATGEFPPGSATIFEATQPAARIYERKAAISAKIFGFAISR
jgi:hypothetical protein